MTEALLWSFADDRLEAYGAGAEATLVRLEAIRAAGEVSIDMTGQESKTVERYLREPFDCVVTVRDDAHEVCPVFRGAKKCLHRSLPGHSAVGSTEEERLEEFRVVRDRLRDLTEANLANAKEDEAMTEAESRAARKQKVLFLCTQNSARSQMAEGFLRELAGDRFEAYSAGLEATDEVHPCAVEAMREVGIDISGQRPKDLSTYMGKEYFNYLIIVCARAEERCPKTFPGVRTTFSWIFDDPRADESLPYDSMLERFRMVRDRIEIRTRGWLEEPEGELKKLREERDRERTERLRRAGSREAAPIGDRGDE
jgi:arsenate reductase